MRLARDEKATIGVLFGFRALMVLFVCNYHIWQLGWLPQYVDILGMRLDFDYFTRSSYLFVDGMLLLSGLLLYLPYARQTVLGTPVPTTKRFYWNRIVRIVPSYLFSVLMILFCIALPGGAYRDAQAQNLDVLTHLTFTFNWTAATYLHTPLNGALWTVAVEMQFYVLFPLLARAAQKKPTLTLTTMALLGMSYRLLIALYVPESAAYINQMPAFLDVYALGMLGANVYVRLQKRWEEPAKQRERRAISGFAVVGLALACWAVCALLRVQSSNGLESPAALRLSQMELRFWFACVLLVAMLCASIMPKILQKLLDNRLMRFLSTISFNLYIWHQVLSARLAADLFPATLHQDLPLRKAYTLLCFALSILVAMLTTYGLEQPAAKLANTLRIKWRNKKHERPTSASAEPSADPVLLRVEEGRTSAD